MSRVVPYSDKLFRRASVEWLVATDQVNNSVSFSMIPILNVYIPHFAGHSSPSTP